MASEGEQARVLDGKALAAEIRHKVAAEVAQGRKEDPSFHPGLTIIQVGGREDSNVYIRMKSKAAREVSVRLLSVRNALRAKVSGECRVLSYM